MPDRREKSESKYCFSGVKAAVICLLLIMALMLPACAGIAPAQEQAVADTQSAEAPASEPAPEETLPEEEAAIPGDNSEPDGAALSAPLHGWQSDEAAPSAPMHGRLSDEAALSAPVRHAPPYGRLSPAPAAVPVGKAFRSCWRRRCRR